MVVLLVFLVVAFPVVLVAVALPIHLLPGLLLLQLLG
jgi:hypothetical protein